VIDSWLAEQVISVGAGQRSQHAHQFLVCVCPCRGFANRGHGGHLHLTDAVEGWLVPGRNPFGLYLYTEDVDRLAAVFRGETIEPHGPEDKPWGMYEFTLSDPDQTLIRVGWPTRLRTPR
jgi:hypothetical protein